MFVRACKNVLSTAYFDFVLRERSGQGEKIKLEQGLLKNV